MFGAVMSDDSDGPGEVFDLGALDSTVLDRYHNMDHFWANSSPLHFASHSINGDHFKIVSPAPFKRVFNSKKHIINKTAAFPSTAYPDSSIKHKSSDQEQKEGKEEHDIVLKTGFSFGERLTSFEPTSPDSHWEDADSDSAIDEIYGTEMTETTVSESIDVDTPRHHSLSQRIDKVGYIGQKISAGHTFGALLLEASELRPKAVKVEQTEYVIDEDSPVQIDVKWSEPENAKKFKSLTYNIQLKSKPSDENWTCVSSVRFPVFRVYHTDDKLLLGKVHLSRQSHDLTYMLRCRAEGDVVHDGGSHLLNGDWSNDISVTFRGYKSVHKVSVSFSL